MAAELRNCSGKNADSFRVFRPEALYRRRGIVRGAARAPSHVGGTTRGQAASPYCVGPSWPHSVSSSVLWKLR
jgi:hypothetical protein